MWNRLRVTWNVLCSVTHFWRPGRVSKLFYFVTSQCNARCSFCFNLDNVVNWQERKSEELTLEEVRQVARKFGRLPWLTMSGGEPFVRPELVEIVEAFYNDAKTQWVTIPSNAALTRQVVSKTSRILERCPGIFLAVQVSLDSMYEDHDQSRKITGGFAQMTATLEELGALRKVHPNLRIQIATCYDDFNLERIPEIIEYTRSNFDYDQQIFYLIRGDELITRSNRHLAESYLKLLMENEEHEWRSNRRTLWHRAIRAFQSVVYGDALAIKLEEKFVRPCHATRKFATLYDNGQVSPCELLEKVDYGNVRDFDYDFHALTGQKEVQRFYREEIVEKKCNCEWMCALPINMLYDPASYPRLARSFLFPDRGPRGR